MMIRVVICQLPIRERGLTLEEKLSIIKKGADIVCLPEYFLMPADSTDYSLLASKYDWNVEYLARLSRDLNTTIVGGTVAVRTGDRMYNTCFVFSKGYRIGSYRKVHPTVREREKGISQGELVSSWNVNGVRIGVLICADVLHSESFEEMKRQNVDIVFVPTTSPYRPLDTVEDKAKRDGEIFVEGAMTAKSYVVKTCATGSIFGKRLQGRSLVAAPWELLWNVFPESESRSIIHSYDLDIDKLREYKRSAMIDRVMSKL
jgi:predicted amidohydrolase